MDATNCGRTTESPLPMIDLVAALRSTFDDGRGSAEERLRRASDLLRDAENSQAAKQMIVRGTLAPWQERKVRSFIETNLNGSIRSANLASLVRLTPCHFIRAFRNSFGDPPMGYVIRLRIKRAQFLMLSTDASLSEIALECGFSDQAYLCRLFRRVVGETPGGWRRARLDPAS